MFFLSNSEETTLPTANASNANVSVPDNQTAILHARNLFFLPYFIYSCILGLISCSVFLRVNYELKMLIMMVALVGYNIILLHTHAHVLDAYSQVLFQRPGIWKDLKTMGSVSLSIFFITLLVLGRQVRLLVEEQVQKRAGGDRNHGEPKPSAAGERATCTRG